MNPWTQAPGAPGSQPATSGLPEAPCATPMRRATDKTFTADETERLGAVRSRRLLDTPATDAFDRITRLASSLFDTSIALVTLMDADRLWFKSRVGVYACETDRSTAICNHTIRSAEVMVVPDLAGDTRFTDSPMLADGYRFYAGAPLLTRGGLALGTLCILDRTPRRFGQESAGQLADLASMVMSQIDLHQAIGTTDEVTRLPNSTQLTADLEDLCAVASGEPWTLVLVEAFSHDQLQEAQRSIGTLPLEAVLRDFAERLGEWLDGRATLYKTNEARFAFLLPGHATERHEALVAEMLGQLQRPLRGGRSQVEMAPLPNTGFATFELNRECISDLLRRAASALHDARVNQRAFAWFAPESDATSRRAYALLQDVPRGLAEGEFRLVYQPKMDLATRLYDGVEALIRWRHPHLGELSPAEFIPLVESSRLIHLLTEWVVHTALAQLAAWEAEGISVTMAVNVSAKNLEHPDFLKVLQNACSLHGISPEKLQVECTENAALDGQQTVQVLHQIRALGVQVSLDDFGIGYCNISALRSLPAELLKLDQSLIRGIATDPRAWALLKSLIQFGHAMGYRLLAEGVETAEVFDLLESSGCDAVQGYYLARPLEAPALAVFLKRHAELFTLDF